VRDFKAETFRTAQTVAKAVSLGLNLLIKGKGAALAGYETPALPVPPNPALRIAHVGRSYSSFSSLWSVIVSLLCCCSIWTCSPSLNPNSSNHLPSSLISGTVVLSHVR